MAKKFVLCLLCLGVLTACGSSHKKQIIQDPLSPKGSTNYLIYDDQGGRSEVIQDPLSPEGFTNYLLFDGSGRSDLLLEDPIFPGNYLLYERKGGN